MWGAPDRGWARPLSESNLEKERPDKAARIAPLALEIPSPIPFKDSPSWKPRLSIPSEPGPLTDSETQRIQGIYNWLCAQQNPLTGLVESFEGSADPFLKDQAATYDQALAGMAFLIYGDAERAKKILDFYFSRWEGNGFCNFYSTVNGRVGLEWRRHVGPNMWVALLVYQYHHFTGDKTYLPLAEGLCDWVRSLPHYNGAPAMSDRDELEIPWREIVSTENVIDAIAAFQIACEQTEDFRKAREYRAELAQMKRFLTSVALHPNGSIARGYRPFLDGVDATPALDTISWLIATALPENLASEYGVPLNRFLEQAETLFWVKSAEGEGYDYTDAAEAAKAGRPRLVSLEWSGEMALVYWMAAHSPDTTPYLSQKYEQKLQQILSALDRWARRDGEKISYPYASLSDSLTFAQGWRTPKATPDGYLPGSVASSCWRLFADRWNPLRLDQPVPLPPIAVAKIPFIETSKKEKERAQFLPSSLTSEGLTTAAWLNLKARQKKEARELAVRCIHLYSKLALQQQAKKAAEGGLVRWELMNEEVKQKIFSYAALNDVAACWFILAQIDPKLHPKASQTVTQHYSLAQVWDPAGKFWTVAEEFGGHNT